MFIIYSSYESIRVYIYIYIYSSYESIRVYIYMCELYAMIQKKKSMDTR